MIKEVEEKSEIATISKKYKDILDDFIDSSNTESPNWSDFLDWPKLINKGLHNTFSSRGSLPTLSKEDYLDEDVLVLSLELAPKI